jgi:hypothetical protein
VKAILATVGAEGAWADVEPAIPAGAAHRRQQGMHVLKLAHHEPSCFHPGAGNALPAAGVTTPQQCSKPNGKIV